MLESKRKAKSVVRSAVRVSSIALLGVFALPFVFDFLPLRTPVFAFVNPSPLPPKTRAAPAAPTQEESFRESEAMPCPETLAIPGKPVVATWEWGKRLGKGANYFNQKILQVKSPESCAYFARLAGFGINRLYLHVKVKAGRLAFNDADLAGFIGRAKQDGMEVYALFGDPSFARTENHPKANAIVKAILHYNETYPDRAFEGIQSDIEPYYEFTPSGATRRTDLGVVGPQYVAGIEKQRELVDSYEKKMGRGLKLEAAIPFWYNIPAERRRSRRAPLSFLFDGFMGTITDHVIRLTDSVAVMSYRNEDEGIDGVGGVAHYVIEAARRYNRRHRSHKKVIISLETKKPGSRGVIPKITICKLSRQALWTSILKRLGQRYKEKPTVAGIAYHHTVPLFELEKRWAGERESPPGENRPVLHKLE